MRIVTTKSATFCKACEKTVREFYICSVCKQEICEGCVPDKEAIVLICTGCPGIIKQKKKAA